MSPGRLCFAHSTCRHLGCPCFRHSLQVSCSLALWPLQEPSLCRHPGAHGAPCLVHARPQPDPNRHVAFAQLFGPPGWVRSVLTVQCISSPSSHCNYTIVSVLLYCSSVEPNRNSTRGIVLAYSLAAQGPSKEQTFSKYF